MGPAAIITIFMTIAGRWDAEVGSVNKDQSVGETI
jgi:hypothetical protein